MKTVRVVVVGSSNTDLVVRTSRLPRPGETVTGGTFFVAQGGKGANQAVAAARLGAIVDFIARLGTDSQGDAALAAYLTERINTSAVIRDAARPTGVALIMVDAAGENLIAVASGANEALCPDDVERAVDSIRAAGAVLVSLEVPWPAVCAAIRLAARFHVPVILNPAPAPASPLDPEVLRHVSVLTPNETEAARLTGCQVHDEATARVAAAALLRAGPRAVVITLGPLGALLATADQMRLVASPRVKAVDTTAAGDAFNGALAVALAQSQTLLNAVAWACRAAALSVTRPGAQPSLPTTAEVDALIIASRLEPC